MADPVESLPECPHCGSPVVGKAEAIFDCATSTKTLRQTWDCERRQKACWRGQEAERERTRKVLREAHAELEATTFEDAYKSALLTGIEEAYVRLTGKAWA